MPISVAELIEKLHKREDVETVIEEARKKAIEARSKLSEKIREFWDSDEGELIRNLLSYEAYDSGYADEVERIMEGVADDLRKVAKTTNIGNLYRFVWGKPTK